MNDNRPGALDRMLASAGSGRLRQNFRELAAANRREALRLLDDEKLTFPPLFTLLPEIYAYKLTDALSPRNYAAVIVCVKKLERYEQFADQAEVQDSEMLYQALTWMFRTGRNYDGMGADRDDYESVIDYVAALLIITFEDTSILPDVANVIFRRQRSGRLIHDLAWCFFQTLDVAALSRVAGNLLSTDPRDVSLSCKMLGLEAPPSTNRQEAKNLHGAYINWLGDNRPYLYATGEHFQQTSRPKPLDVDSEAKYLGKELSPRYRAPVEPLSEREVACLHEYRGFPPEEQEMLTDYSHRLRSANALAWDAWMSKQVAEQVIAARSGVEAI
jgi:DNA-binding transcriptional ArsR family regulator